MPVWSPPPSAQFPAFAIAEASFPSTLESQTAKVPGFVTSFARQPRRPLPAFPATFVLSPGHFPSPGTSDSSVSIHVSTDISISVGDPGQALPALEMAAANFSWALARQLESTGSPALLALAWQPIIAFNLLPAALSLAWAHFCAGVAAACAAGGATANSHSIDVASAMAVGTRIDIVSSARLVISRPCRSG
jgi:hypothetical protein